MDVLVVEDDPLMREVMMECLQQAGRAVAEAAAAEAALEAARTAGPPAVLVTDVYLGRGMDGLSLAALALGRWPSLGIVMVTGIPAALARSVRGPRVRCLTKPFAPAALVASVEDLAPRIGRG